MSHHLGRCLVISIAAAGVLGGCEGKVNDDENFFVLTFRASLDPAGVELTGPSERARITPNGQFIVFETRARNVQSTPTNGRVNIYRKEIATGAVVRATLEEFIDATPDINEDCVNASMTPDGRYVVFESASADLHSDQLEVDANGFTDVFLADLTDPGDIVITRISQALGGGDSDGPSRNASISDDGRFIAFESTAQNLTASDNNGPNSDIYIRDLLWNITLRVSNDENGLQGNDDSNHPVLSGDGSKIVFDSRSDNLVADDTNVNRDVFIKSWTLGIPTVTRVSVEGPLNPDGNSNDVDNADGESLLPSVSQDGRFVAFVSFADDLITGDNNSIGDYFIRDLANSTTKRLTESSSGGEASQFFTNFVEGTPAFRAPEISRDGRWVTFHSPSPDMVLGDTNNAVDVFLRDTVLNTTIRISVATYGLEASPFFDSRVPTITSDGRFVAFTSQAPNLAPNDTNGTADIYIRGPLY